MALADIDGLPRDAVLGLASSGMLAIAHLPTFFGDRSLQTASRFGWPARQDGTKASAWLGWGNRRSGQAARQLAKVAGVPFALLEDGFIRSVGLGKTGAPPVSLVVDDEGIYYDAAGPSRLERLIGSAECSSPQFQAAAAQALARWRAERLSKYNLGDDDAPPGLAGKIILVDQVHGDASLAGAGAGQRSFAAMLALALQNHSADRLVVLTHPDVREGKARGCLTELAAAQGISVLAQALSPHAILDVAAQVWTVSSGLGFEALLRGVPVTCFAAPFYAGWGLTDDKAVTALFQAAQQRRCARPTLETLFGAAFLRYARYADPVTRRALDFHGAVDRLAEWRKLDRARGRLASDAFGFSRWKRKAATAFLSGTQGSMQYHGKATPRALRRLGGTQARRIAVWGMTDRPGFAEGCRQVGHTLLRVEDGFLRSVGLGSDLLAPGSLVLDDLGLYYDARQESRLERILARDEFSPELLSRASALRAQLCANAITKYNLGHTPVDLRHAAGARRIVLVAEQVPGDASLRFGGGDVAGNLALLHAVRQENPAAFIVYKEHPDLVAGNRRGRLAPQLLRASADLVLSRGDMAGLFGQIDALHVMSSLAGFEALLRGVAVDVWGRPFYAGWGLTRDHAALPRRNRRLSLDELVAGTLITYPLYADPVSHVPCSVEDFMLALAAARAGGPAVTNAAGLTGQMRWLRRWLLAALRKA